MKLKKGDMWSALDHADLFLVTTNAMVRKDGALVMGRGIAREAATRYTQLPYEAGKWLKVSGLQRSFYGVLRPYPQLDHPMHKLGLFQVKFHWADDASLDLIANSTQVLRDLIEEEGYEDVHLNFPGIGNGRLSYSDVLPVVKHLPDAVTLWTRT